VALSWDQVAVKSANGADSDGNRETIRKEIAEVKKKLSVRSGNGPYCDEGG
jgi:hypothetical protein